MPWTNNASIQSLRLQYNAALTAHKASRQAVVDAKMDGATPAASLIETERKANALLAEIRAKLLAEMTTAITGGTDVQPPTL